MNNILTGFPASLSEEWTEVLAENSQTRIERIVSQGHASPPGFWYDQDQHEWVMLLQGEARLLLEGEDQPIVLQSGDHLVIPAHKRHRVESTSIECPTIWLAVFYNQN